MSNEKDPTVPTGENVKKNETVAGMSADVRSDVPTGLAVIPKGQSAHALARRTTGDIIQSELEFHCMGCGWNKSLHFDPDEIKALDGNIRDYSGPCPSCGAMTLVPKDALWGNDFPSMSAMAKQNKKAEARDQAEAFVDVVEERIGGVFGGAVVPKPTTDTDPAPAGGPPNADDLPDEADTSDLKPR